VFRLDYITLDLIDSDLNFQ